MLTKEIAVEILQQGLLEIFPTLDVSEDSDAYIAVIEPIARRLTTPDFTTDPTEFLKDLVKQEHPDIATDDGGPFSDLVLKPAALLLRPVWQEMQEQNLRMAATENATALSAEEVDLALSNLFTDRRQGRRSIVPVRVYYAAPSFDTWLPTDWVGTKSGLRYNPVTQQAIETAEMATNVEGSEYYFDITLQAEEPGDEYNVAKESITEFDSDAHPSVTRIQNMTGASKGLKRETNEEFVDSTESSLTERSLGTNRGIGARIRDLFKDQVTDYWAVGYNDPEQDRDVITGRDYGLPVLGGVYFSVGRFMVLISNWEDRGESWSHTISEGDEVDLHFGPSYVYGQLPVAYRNQTNEIETVLLASAPTGEAAVGIYAFLLKDRPIVSNTALFDIPQFTTGGAIVKKQGVIRLSDIPGGIEFGANDELAIAPNQIHIGGHVDVYVNAADTEERTTIFDAAISEGEIWSGEDLVTEGAGSVRNRVGHATADLDWVAIGVKPTKHSLQILEGDDKNQYRILAAGADYLILDSELLRSDTGLQYKIVGPTHMGLTDSSVTIYPTASSTATLRSDAGSTSLKSTVNLKDYGVLAGDTIVIDEDDNPALASEYIIVSWSQTEGGKVPEVHKPLPDTYAGIPFTVIRKSLGVELPMVRTKKVNLLDSSGKKVGVDVPYALPVDARNPRDFCGSFDICDDEFGVVLPDLQTFTLEDRECRPCLWPTNWNWPDPRDADTGDIPEPEWWAGAMGSWPAVLAANEWPAGSLVPAPDDWADYCASWSWPPEDFLPNGKLVLEFWDPRTKYPWLADSDYTDPAQWGLLDVDYNDIAFDNVWSPYWEWAGDALVRFPYAYSGKALECDGYIVCLCTKFNEVVDDIGTVEERSVQYEICLPGSLFDGYNNVLMALPNFPWQELSQWHDAVFVAEGEGPDYAPKDEWEDLTPGGHFNPYTGEFERGAYYPYEWMEPDEPNPAWDLPPVPPPCLCHASPGDIVTIGSGGNKGAYVIKKLHTVPLNFGLFALDPDMDFLGGEWTVGGDPPPGWPSNWDFPPLPDALPTVAPAWWTGTPGLGKTTEDWEVLDDWPELSEAELADWDAYWIAQIPPVIAGNIPAWPPSFDPEGEVAEIPGEGSQYPPRHVWEATITMWVCFAEIHCEFPYSPIGELIPWYCEKYLTPVNSFGKYSLHDFLNSISQTLSGLTGTESYEEPSLAYTVWDGSAYEIYVGQATNWPATRTSWPSPAEPAPVLTVPATNNPVVGASGVAGQHDQLGCILPHIVRTWTGKQNSGGRRDLLIYTGYDGVADFFGNNIGLAWVQTQEKFTSPYIDGGILDSTTLSVIAGADIIPNEAGTPGDGDYFVLVCGADSGPKVGVFVYTGTIDETGASLAANFAPTGMNLIEDQLPPNEIVYNARIRRKPTVGTAFPGYYMLVLTYNPVTVTFWARIFETDDSALGTVMTEVNAWSEPAASDTAIIDFMVFNSGEDVRAMFTWVDPGSGLGGDPRTRVSWDSILTPAHSTWEDMDTVLYSAAQPADWGPLDGPPPGYVVWASAGSFMNDPWGHSQPNQLGALLLEYLAAARRCVPLPNTGRDRDGEPTSVFNTWDVIDLFAQLPGYALETAETDITVPMEAIGQMINLALEDTILTLPAISTDPGQIYNFLMETFFVKYKIGAPSRGVVRVNFQEPTTAEFLSTCDLWSKFKAVVDNQELTFAAIPNPEEYQLIPVRTGELTPVEELPRTLIVADKISGVVQIQDEGLPTLVESEIRIGEDVLEIYPEIYFNYLSGVLWKKYWTVRPVNSGVAGLIGRELSAHVRMPDIDGYVFRPEDVGDFIFIEEGESAAGYRIVEWVSPSEVVLDRALSHSTLPHIAVGKFELVEQSYTSYKGVSTVTISPYGYAWSGSDEEVLLYAVNPEAGVLPGMFTPDDVGKYVTIWGSPDEVHVDGTYRIKAVCTKTPYVAPAGSRGEFPVAILDRAVTGNLGYGDTPTYGQPFGLFAIHAAPDEEMPSTEAGGTELAGVMPFRMYRGAELEGNPLQYEISHIDPSLDPLGSYFTVRRVGAAAFDSYIPAGRKMPFRIVRPNIQRISSTEMDANREYGLHWMDVEIFSLGSGTAYNIDADTKLEPVFGTFNSDGYYIEAVDPQKTFTTAEEARIHLSNRVLPVGLLDSPENYVLLPGRSISVDYDYSAVVRHIQSVFSSSDERDICSDVLVHAFLPSYVYLYMAYYGGLDPNGIYLKVREFIAGRGATKELAIWELERILRQCGATRVDRNSMLISLTHDKDRRIVGNRSTEKLGGDSVYFFSGSNRIQYFQAGANMSLIDEEDRTPGERIVLEKAGSGSTSR
jgi:hypothetical protein